MPEFFIKTFCVSVWPTTARLAPTWLGSMQVLDRHQRMAKSPFWKLDISWVSLDSSSCLSVLLYCYCLAPICLLCKLITGNSVTAWALVTNLVIKFPGIINQDCVDTFWFLQAFQTQEQTHWYVKEHRWLIQLHGFAADLVTLITGPKIEIPFRLFE